MLKQDQLGGFFESTSLPAEENHFFESITPANGSIRFLMSGRCGILCALEDWKPQDRKRVAYVPAYTCGTVLAPYVKAGYRLKFYEINRAMQPVFDPAVLDEISVINLCGYYGFNRYDRSLIQECKARGICIIQDATHSVLSLDGMDSNADYIAGSLRKWIGVPSGGFLIKRQGEISPRLLPYHADHLAMRKRAMDLKRKSLEAPGSVSQLEMDEAAFTFRQAELLLRQIFDCYESDPESVQIMKHFPVSQHRIRRRKNYQRLLETFPQSEACTVVFPELDGMTVPSHFTVLAEDRDALKAYLETQGIHTTAYWAKSPLADTSACPQAEYIYQHVLSLPCDQRYTETDMERISRSARSFYGYSER